MKKTPAETLPARIGRVLAQRIMAGELKGGDRLRQDAVAHEFGASHVPVREAFRRLEAQGLAVSLPRRGVRVASFDAREIREVAEMRASLECLALRHAAPRLTPAILDQAEEVNGASDRARDVESWEAANRSFHRLLLAPCAMPRLLRTIDELQVVSARFLFAGWQAEWEAPTDRDHRAILAALRAGEIETAALALARHVRLSGRRERAENR